MDRLNRMLRRGLAPAALVAALGFGAVQALAAPRDDAGGRACMPDSCNRSCINRGAEGGSCVDGNCLCRLPV
ncbi:MAG TPA: hypothetical protein VF746_03730 [Longimicrobium sp.]|jgi:hypothetical protein